MNKIQKIGAGILLLATLNVVLGKAVHEIFEHHHHEHTCDFVGQIHFHESEITHPDLICDFHFSTSFLENFSQHFNSSIFYFGNKVEIHFLWLTKALCSSSFNLRGPPLF